MSERKVPKLRFPEFSGEYLNKSLGEVATFSQGVQASLEVQSQEPKDGYVRFIRIENYTQNSVDFRYIPSDLAINKEISDNDIVIVRYGASAGYVAKGFSGVIANNLFTVSPQSYLCKNYLYIILTSDYVYKYFQSQMVGGAMPALSFKLIENLDVYYPSYKEQTKIADFITVIDGKIQQLTKKKELLEQYKKGVMQQIFSQQIRFKDDNGNDYPDWEEKQLNEICTFFSGGTPISSNKDYYNGDIPFIGSGSISSNQVEQFITHEALINSSAKMIENGDLLLALYGATSGQSAIAKLSGAINQAVLCIRTQECKEFIFYWLQLNKDNILSTYLQGGQGNLSAQIIKQLEIDIPSMAEQIKISGFLSNIDDKITQVNTRLEQTKLFKKSLLQQMFI